MKQLLSKRLVLDASLYYSYLDNAMIRAPYSFNGTYSMISDGEMSQILAVKNLDYAIIWGYQFGIRTEFTKSLFWTIHWSHPFGSDSEGNSLRHANPFNATSQLVFRKKRWSATITGRYNGAVSYTHLTLPTKA